VLDGAFEDDYVATGYRGACCRSLSRFRLRNSGQKEEHGQAGSKDHGPYPHHIPSHPTLLSASRH
jgi:hypothetical protein